MDPIEEGHGHIMNLKNHTDVFKNLFLNYNKKKKSPTIPIKLLMIKNIESAIDKLKSKEKENEYLVTEVRRHINIKNQILNSFGTKALNHYEETKNLEFKMKLDKKKLLFDYSRNAQKTFMKNKNYNSQKIINFPKITGRTKSDFPILFTEKSILNSKKNLLSNITNSYSFDNQNETSEIIKIKSNDISQSDSKLIENKEKVQNNNNESTTKDFNDNYFPKITKSPLKKENKKSNILNSKTNSKSKKNIQTFINIDFINKIQKLKENLINEEKKNMRYFYNNKYGYDVFKDTYNHLKQKFFDKK